MTAEELEKDKFYWCAWLGDWVKYCGIQHYEGQDYHNFFRPGLGLFYWLDPEQVTVEQVTK